MAKDARIGQMRTKALFQRLADTGTDAEGVPSETWENLFAGQPVWCMWINPHGSEIYENMRLDLRETATITMRYTPLVDVRCRVFRDYAPTGDPELDEAHAWEVVSVDNVRDLRRYMEIKLRKRVKA